MCVFVGEVSIAVHISPLCETPQASYDADPRGDPPSTKSGLRIGNQRLHGMRGLPPGTDRDRKAYLLGQTGRGRDWRKLIHVSNLAGK